MKSDDPNLTAYALGELDPDTQSSAAKTLAGSPEVAAEAWAIRSFGARLARELQAEPAPGLRPEQRARVLVEVDRAAAIIEAERLWWRGWLPAAIAACAALVLGGSFLLQNQDFAQWWAHRIDLSGLHRFLADEAAEKAKNNEVVAPVGPAVQDMPTFRTTRAVPGIPQQEALNLPPAPSDSTARLTLPPPLNVEKPQAQPLTVDPASIPMKGTIHIVSRPERVRTRIAAKPTAASPTPDKK